MRGSEYWGEKCVTNLGKFKCQERQHINSNEVDIYQKLSCFLCVLTFNIPLHFVKIRYYVKHTFINALCEVNFTRKLLKNSKYSQRRKFSGAFGRVHW
jgi:hypothetical protein